MGSTSKWQAATVKRHRACAEEVLAIHQSISKMQAHLGAKKQELAWRRFDEPAFDAGSDLLSGMD